MANIDSNTHGFERTRPSITKKTYVSGLQCHRLLWRSRHERSALPAPASATQARFEQGRLIGELVRTLKPDALDLEGRFDRDDVLHATHEAIRARRAVFEAAVAVKDLYIRIDLLEPVDADSWRLIEVKSSTSVKEEHLDDVAFQVHVARKAGLRIEEASLLHVDSSYVRDGEIDVDKLFIREDVTDRLEDRLRRIPEELERQRTALARSAPPEVPIGPQCTNPYACPFQPDCWSHVPERSVFKLYRGGAKSWDLYASGITKVENIPDTVTLTDRQSVQRQATVSEQIHFDHEAVGAFLESIEFPVAFMDFETINTAVPLIDRSSPYQQIPFQWSLHRQETRGASVTHTSFLADGGKDPRPEFMAGLFQSLEGTRSIVVYNQSFEIGRLRECAQLLPQYADTVADIESRIVDLLKPFRAFAAYHPDQNGSCSIKAVLPAWTGKSYEGLVIGNGEDAALEYLRTHFGDGVTVTDKQQVRERLEEYCALDTLGMVRLLEALQKFCKIERLSPFSESA